MNSSKAAKFHFDHMKLCGCGSPTKLSAMLMQCLAAFGDEIRDRPFEERGVLLIEKIITQNPAIAAELLAQFLDSRDLLEHGGTVFGSWLSKTGKEVLEAGPYVDGDWYITDEGEWRTNEQDILEYNAEMALARLSL